MKKLTLLLMVVSLVSIPAAASMWDPAGNGIFPPDAGNWNLAANWTPNGVPGGADAAVFSLIDAAECQVTTPDATCWYLVMGDNGSMLAPLVIKDGGTLTTGDNWSAVAYNQSATMIVERGGTVDFGNHLWLGMSDGADGTLTINGGTVNVGVAFDIGRAVGAQGLVSVNTGLMSVTHVTTPTASGWYMYDGGVIDI
ncbi:MAG: hypothetical protein KAJ07_12980, partial [Planctomycetes bacterium]|nr:hypothetical protein [Planctomycetota bacterium]